MRVKDEMKANSIKMSVIKLSRQEGFQGVSMSKIAKDCGVSASTIYTYYENKDAMIKSIFHELRFKRNEEAFANIKEGESAYHTLKEIFKRYYQYITSHEDEYYYLRQFLGCSCYQEEIANKEYQDRINTLLGRFIASGELINFDVDVIHALMSSPVDKFAESYFGTGQLMTNQEIEEIFNIIWKSIGKDKK